MPAALPEATQSVEGHESNEPVPLLLAVTEPMVNCVCGTRAPGVLSETPLKLKATVPFAVDAEPVPAATSASADTLKTAFSIFLKTFSSGFLNFF
jgi:hypothetical protein